MPLPDILILSSDPLAAALLGAAVEYAGFAAHFPADGESARDALRRVRPALTLVDCDSEEACSEAFIGPVMMTGARTVVFRSGRSRRDASALVDKLRLASITLPLEHDELARVLREALADEGEQGGGRREEG